MKNSDVKTVNVLFCGTGGQGVLKAAEVCGWAALFDGFHVKKSEVHGMAQRGGSVESHLRFGKEVFSPLIPAGEVDFLVSFHKDEHLRMKELLKPSGCDLVNYLTVSFQHIKEPRYLNTFLLGVLSSKLNISEESWDRAVDLSFSNKSLDENKRIFSVGREVGR